MNAAVEILIGTSGAGKTSRLVSDYQEELARAARECRPGSTLWLSPTHRSAHAIRDSLFEIRTTDEEKTAVCFAPNVMTFDVFAEQILKFSGRRIAALTPIAKRMMLRNIISECLSRGTLSYFSSIAHTAGFLDLVSSFISELKRDEIWPEQFEEACRSRGLSDKDRELTLLYKIYQECLLERERYDAEGRFWSAREALANGHRKPFEQLSLVVVDGFSDFTHTQYEILSHLATFAQRMVISLQAERPLQRADLFAKTEIARERVSDAMQSVASKTIHIVELSPRSETKPNGRPAFRQIVDSLFDNPRNVSPLDDADGIEVVTTTGRLGEVRSLAQRVKRLLLTGVPAEEIVVAVRNLDDYADLFEETFQAAAIPFWSEAGEQLERSPLVKALLAVIQLEREGWPFARLAAIVNSNYFRPQWNSVDNDLAARSLLAQLRRLKLPSDREAMIKGLSRVAGQQLEDNENPHVQAAKTGLSLLEGLSAVTRPLGKKAAFGKWVETVLGVSRELGMVPVENANEEQSFGEERDQRVWDAFVGILKEAARAEKESSENLPFLNLTEFYTQLVDLLQNQSLSPRGNGVGNVLVLEAEQVRNLDIPYLFLAGLTETSFPQNRNDDCLYGEAERKQLNEQGIALGNRSSRSQDEMLLFYNIVTRARKQLCLSYPSVHENGQPLYPSPYLSALTDLFTSTAMSVTTETEFDPVPAHNHAMTPADLRLVATADVRKKQAGLFRTLFEWPRTSATALNVLAAAETAQARFYERTQTGFDGIIQHPRHHELLAEKFPAEHQFSATALETYATCGFQYYLSRILNIEPLESPETSTDYLSRGSLVHDVLATVHRELFEGPETIPGKTSEEIAERFQQLVNEQLGRRIDDSDLQKALTKIEQQLLHEWASAYGLQHDEYFSTIEPFWDVAPVPRHFETPFGEVPGRPDEVREESFDSISFGSGTSTTHVQGRIDRVDIGQVNGEPVYNVIDYKSGKPPRFSEDDVRSGRAIQLVLYTLAVQRLDLIGNDAAPFLMGYWSIRETGFVDGVKGSRRNRLAPLDEAVLSSLEAILEEIIPRLAEGIRDGDFSLNVVDPDCTAFCPYNTVCRVNQVRPLQEKLNRQAEA